MILRYSHPDMREIWSDQNRYLNWLRVETAVCEELAHSHVIPKKDWAVLKKKLNVLIRTGGVNAKRVESIEKKTRHDVIAFTTVVAERVGPTARYVHFGLTSSDVLDSALALQIQEAGKILLNDLDSLLKVLKEKAKAYEKLPTIGRSHGIYAEPTSFGLKFLGWYTEFQRSQRRLKDALEDLRFGKLSGAVGVCAHWSPQFEEKVLKRLGLKREPVSTQVVPRDRHAHFFNVLALAASSIERVAVEIRHLQRSEVSEVMEGFSKGQKGSSAMPHKRNPISSENLTGCARLMRGYAQSASENVALWHERDISHSSVERIAFPDATELLSYSFRRLTRVLDSLVIREPQIRAHLEDAGKTVFSGHYLLELVQKGATREEGYRWIQECALQSLEGKGAFEKLVEAHPEIRKRITAKRIQELGSISYQLKNVKEVYRKVLSIQK